MLRNLSHYQNSCAINATFITLSYLGCESDDPLISDLINYTKFKSYTPNISNDSLVLLKKFYKEYNLNNDFKSCYQIINLIKNKLKFTHGTLLFEDLAKDLKLTNTTVVDNIFNNALLCVDFQQILSMLDYYDDRSLKVEMSTKRGLISELLFNNNQNKTTAKYLPCLYVVCDNYHYKVYVNTRHGVKLYDDLQGKVTTHDRVMIDVLNRDKINNVEFVIYIKTSVLKK